MYYDDKMTNTNSATISVLAGAGGDDAKDWASMLLRMYGRYADLRKWKKEFVNDTTLEISAKGGLTPPDSPSEARRADGKGDNVYEYLKEESGVHRLVRISPFDSKKLRHTSFALVEVLPILLQPELARVQIPEKDLKIEFYRSGGPGGQNVNKVETAVRFIHIPTGLVAASQVERGQAQNRDRALALLKIKLLTLMEKKHEQSIENLKTKVKPEWGHEIRSYVLHPYKQVKDHRTGLKISRVEEVLDGNLELLSKLK